MRRAALAAIALVLGVFLLTLPRGWLARSTRREARPAPAVRLPSAAQNAEPAPPAGATENETPTADPDSSTGGSVIDEDGSPLRGIRLLAIPRDNVEMWDAEDPRTSQGEEPAAPFTHTDEQGAFAFADLPPGDYRLAVDEDRRMLDAPLFFRAGTRGLRVVAVQAWRLAVRVRDLATRERVARFLVRYTWPPEGPERVGEGIDGLFRVRKRHAGQELGVPCRIEAEGYHDTTAVLFGAEHVVWLLPVVEARVTLRVLFDDGGLCEEVANVVLQRAGGSATAPAEPIGAGSYRLAVPPGSWTLEFRPEKTGFLSEPCTTSFDLAEGEDRAIFLQMERGGDIVVRCGHWDGKPWWLSVADPGGHLVNVRIAEAAFEARHVRPGRYVIHLPAASPEERVLDPFAVDPSRKREVDVTNGSRHEMTID